MRFASLGSGSQGNGLIVEHDGYRILVDCGFGLADTARRLARLELEPGDLHAIVVTHEHDDHAGGVARLAAKYRLPVWMTPGTLRGMEGFFSGCDVRPIDGYRPFSMGSMQVSPYPVPHDAREPAQYVFSDGRVRLGLVTDAGEVTPHMIAVLTGCDGLLLEFNHDAELLRRGRYPDTLKRRISGRWGHLANEAAQALLAMLAGQQLRTVVGMHLSHENNRPELVRSAMEGVLGRFSGQVGIACQDAGTPWFAL